MLVLAANMSAATLSFTLSRTLGKQLAQRVIEQEMKETEVSSGSLQHMTSVLRS